MEMTRRDFLKGLGKLGIALAATQIPNVGKKIEILADNLCPKNTAYIQDHKAYVNPEDLKNLTAFQQQAKILIDDCINQAIKRLQVSMYHG